MIKETLKKLCLCPSPSGFEFMTQKLVSDMYSDKVAVLESDGIGNQYLWPHTKNDSKPTLMISAHIDEIGLQLAARSDKSGTWRVGRLGGIDTKTFPGSHVRCYTSPLDTTHPWVPGVIGKKPIHLETPEERKDALKLKDLEVDFGDLETLKPGMPVVPERFFSELGTDKVSAPGLDDKSGCAVCLDVLDRILESKKELNLNVVIVLCAQEETGLRGAYVAARKINPDFSIDLDVSFAGPRGDLPGEIEVGKGPIVSFGPDKDYEMSHTLDKSEIPHQVEVTSAGGTNTAAIQESSLDCRCALLSIPEKNMHTAAEIVSIQDLQDCSDMIMEYIDNL